MFSTVAVSEACAETAAPGVPPFTIEATIRASSTPVDSHVEDEKFLQNALFFIHRNVRLCALSVRLDGAMLAPSGRP
jgi:hypothetical protein